MTMPASGTEPEFARPVEVPRAAGRATTHKIAADADERAALAARFSLLSLDRLAADIRIERLPGGLVRLAASLVADVVQSCVVTLEPVSNRVEEEFILLFGAGEAAREVVLDGAAETIEPLDGDRIDLGEVVAQQLSLALDPFPRAADASLDPLP
jgi:uncharacterized metal-binding protein YceD (DUF177 family)